MVGLFVPSHHHSTPHHIIQPTIVQHSSSTLDLQSLVVLVLVGRVLIVGWERDVINQPTTLPTLTIILPTQRLGDEERRLMLLVPAAAVRLMKSRV